MKPILLLCILSIVSCAAPQTDIIGTWGDKSSKSSMVVSKEMATIDFACASAEIPSALPNHLSAFTKSGTYTIEHGIIYEGQDTSKDIREASFAFRFDGNDLVLTITDVENNSTLGSYTFEYDVDVIVPKCQ